MVQPVLDAWAATPAPISRTMRPGTMGRRRRTTFLQKTAAPGGRCRRADRRRRGRPAGWSCRCVAGNLGAAGGACHDPARHSRRFHARRHQQGDHVPCPRSAAGAGGVGPDLPCRDGQPRPVWPPARWHGRGRVFAVQGLRACPLGAGGCGYRLHVRSGADPRGGGGLSRELRQHVLGGGAVRGRRGAGGSQRRHGVGAHLQHQHGEADPRQLPAARRPCPYRWRAGDPRRRGNRGADPA